MRLPRPASDCSPRPGSTSALDRMRRFACARSPPTRVSPNRRSSPGFTPKTSYSPPHTGGGVCARWSAATPLQSIACPTRSPTCSTTTRRTERRSAHALQEDRIPAIRNLTDKGRAYHRDWANRVFQSLLAGLPRASRERRLTALVIATDVLVWKQLRLDMQLSRPQAEKIVLEMIESYSRRSN